MPDFTVRLKITQVLPVPNDMAGWRVLRSDDGGVTFPQAVDETQWVYPGEQAEYTYDIIETVSSGEKTFQYKFQAVDTDGYASVYSNVVSCTISLVPPDAPVAVEAVVV